MKNLSSGLLFATDCVVTEIKAIEALLLNYQKCLDMFFLFCEVYNMKLFRYTVCIELRVVMEKGMKMNVKGVTYGPGPMFANKTRVWKQGLT